MMKALGKGKGKGKGKKNNWMSGFLSMLTAEKSKRTFKRADWMKGFTHAVSRWKNDKQKGQALSTLEDLLGKNARKGKHKDTIWATVAQVLHKDAKAAKKEQKAIAK